MNDDIDYQAFSLFSCGLLEFQLIFLELQLSML